MSTTVKKNKEKILVVGGSGFIGFATVQSLLHAGFSVRVLDSFIHSNFPSDVQTYNGTTTNHDLVTQALNNCDRVIFLGGNNSPGIGIPSIEKEIRDELLPVIQFAETCAVNGCKQFIFASSGGTIYGPSSTEKILESQEKSPISTYGVSKLTTELYLSIIKRTTGMDTLSLRLSNPYGPGQLIKRNQGFIAAAMSAIFNDEVLNIWGDGSIVRDYIYIDDIAEAFTLACLQNPFTDSINIASSTGLSLLEVCNAINTATGDTLKINFEPARKVDISRNVLDIKRAKDKLAWSPKTTMKEGLERTIKWWKK